MGRPLTPPDKKIRNDISIKFTDAQKAALKEISRVQCNSMAAVVRTFVSWGIKEWEKLGNEREINHF